MIGLDFCNGFTVTNTAQSLPQDQVKRELFNNPEFLNKYFKLAKSKTKLLFTTNFTPTGISSPKLNQCFKWYKIFCGLDRETIPSFCAKEC